MGVCVLFFQLFGAEQNTSLDSRCDVDTRCLGVTNSLPLHRRFQEIAELGSRETVGPKWIFPGLLNGSFAGCVSFRRFSSPCHPLSVVLLGPLGWAEASDLSDGSDPSKRRFAPRSLRIG